MSNLAMHKSYWSTLFSSIYIVIFIMQIQFVLFYHGYISILVKTVETWTEEEVTR